MRFYRFCTVWLLIIIATPLIARETLPPYHWANQYVDYLKVRGYLPELLFSERPFSRERIATALLKIDFEKKNIPETDRRIIRILFEEFSEEIHRLGGEADNRWEPYLKRALEFLKIELAPETIQPELKIGGFGFGNYLNQTQPAVSDGRIDLHAQAGFFWGSRVTLYNNMRIFNFADSTYIGKKFRSLYAYTEQSYLSLNWNWLQFKFGRDFMQIGPGRSGQLLISDNSRPFDMYLFRIGTSLFQYSFWGFALDSRPVTDMELRSFSTYAKRFLNGHRLQFNYKNKIFAGISEVVVYGGPNQGWNLGLMNPFMIYYGHVVNSPDVNGNSLFNIDFDIYPTANWEVYGEFLIDDFQVDKKSPGDLEPNELGFLFGVQHTNPFGLDGTTFGLEYVQIRNRTYNVPVNDWEKYLHRNRVIGYYLGNNLDRLELTVKKYMRPDLQMTFRSILIRRGEGSVAGEFNTNYLNYTVEEGYNEPFPFGVVEKQIQIGAGIFYRPSQFGNITATLNYNRFSNYKHVTGRKHNNVEFRVSLWLEWDQLIRLASD